MSSAEAVTSSMMNDLTQGQPLVGDDLTQGQPLIDWSRSVSLSVTDPGVVIATGSAPLTSNASAPSVGVSLPPGGGVGFSISYTPSTGTTSIGVGLSAPVGLASISATMTLGPVPTFIFSARVLNIQVDVSPVEGSGFDAAAATIEGTIKAWSESQDAPFGNPSF